MRSRGNAAELECIPAVAGGSTSQRPRPAIGTGAGSPMCSFRIDARVRAMSFAEDTFDRRNRASEFDPGEGQSNHRRRVC